MSRSVRRHPRTAAVLACCLMLTLAACSNTSDPSGSASFGEQPARSGDFVTSAFADLPTPGGAKRLAPAAEQDGAWTESYEVVGLSPADVLRFYATSLTPEWTPVGAAQTLGGCNSPESVGAACTSRADWSDGAMRLEVTAGSDGQPTESADEGATQLNLVLTGAT